MIETEKLARKYATALLRHYQWYEKDMSWIERLSAVAQFLKTQRKYFLYAPRSRYEMVFKTFNFNEHGIHAMILLLEQQQRLLLLPDVVHCVVDSYKKRHGIEYCHVSSATALTDVQEQKIKELLENVSGKKLFCFFNIDPLLIAGIRARAETFVWEDSVEQRLRMLEQV